MMRRLGMTVGLLVLLGLAACQHNDSGAPDQQPLHSSPEVLAKGRYLLQIAGCKTCHTRRGGQDWAGGRSIQTPFGTFQSPNITPDATTGIGGWTADDFWQALHFGKAPDGSRLYPAFPYDAYTHIRRDDSDAMYLALMAEPAVQQTNRPPDLGFPYNQRWLLPLWQALFFDPGSWQGEPNQSDAWNRGAYLVKGVGHCASCHGPRNALGAVVANLPLAGSMIAGQQWFAPNLSTREGGGLADWTREEIAAYLRSGRSHHGTAYGPMAEFITQSLQYLADDDADAIATWLVERPAQSPAPNYRGLIPTPREGRELVSQGRDIYLDRCAGCHGKDGQGKGVYPDLKGNSAVQGHPVNAIRAVLLGGFEPTTRSNPRPWSMPPFAAQLDDAEVAAVVSYLRVEFGDGSAPILPQTVAKYRSAQGP